MGVNQLDAKDAVAIIYRHELIQLLSYPLRAIFCDAAFGDGFNPGSIIMTSESEDIKRDIASGNDSGL